ncbi:MAG: hypothetical protein HQL84_10325 [Magnetococcales bacterium]|nr:hypothetical protein [Magnetococcales bacterium]MBF0150428.1 hypothetical protein [Magnetococcales bacterium]MBF0346800.1 hypothetical protein [Magnetococcales bacterium]MBF0630944.1 hypothetical protein [Magnetococcales bacterium]
MSIRRVGKAETPASGSVSSAKSRGIDGIKGEIFARHLADVAGPQETEAVETVNAVGQVTAVGDREPTSHQRREQLLQTGELLDSLAALGRDMEATGKGDSMANFQLRSHLRKTRDIALRTLSDSPTTGLERDLLHRTTVLATVELAKSDRGDYK